MIILLIVLALAAAAVILQILIFSENRENRELLEQVAEEGYETALEILSPKHKFIFRDNYCGPVLGK